MQFFFTIRQTEVSPSSKKFITEKIQQKLSKFIDDDNTDIHVTIATEKHLNIVELSLNAYGVLFKSSDKSADLCATVDNVIEKIQKQLMKKKEKVKKKYKVHGTGKIKAIQQ